MGIDESLVLQDFLPSIKAVPREDLTSSNASLHDVEKAFVINHPRIV